MSKVGGRDRLLESAHKAFAFEGFDRVGVAQILQSAGVQAPTLYHHFGDKEGLYSEWATLVLTDLGDRIAQATGSATTLLQSLEGIGVVLLGQLDFDLRQLLKDTERLAKPSSRERVLGAYLKALYNPLYGALVRSVGRGELRADSVGLMAEAFLGGAQNLTRHAKRSPEASAEIAAWWARAFLGGVARIHG